MYPGNLHFMLYQLVLKLDDINRYLWFSNNIEFKIILDTKNMSKHKKSHESIQIINSNQFKLSWINSYKYVSGVTEQPLQLHTTNCLCNRCFCVVLLISYFLRLSDCKVQEIFQGHGLNYFWGQIDVAAVVNSSAFLAFVINKQYFEPVELPIYSNKFNINAVASYRPFICFLHGRFLYSHR